MTFQCATPALPTIQRDDSLVRITRWDFEPGATTGWHEHGWVYFIVLLTDAILQLDDGARVTATALVAGQSYMRPAGVKHDVRNGSPHSIAFVEIEIKDAAALSA